MTTPKPSVFISYSHKDEEWMARLADHLRLYELEELLTVWEDRQIGAGQDWLPAIDSAIQGARVAVLLISNAFLISPFIRGKEVPPILERRKANGLVVVPVIVSACNWQDVPWLSAIQARPAGKPLLARRGNDREAALAAIAKEIKRLLQVEAPAQPVPAPVTSPTPAMPRSAVHQLPSPPLDFTGRAADLDALRAAVREGKTTAIFGVRGMGGVGKTTLALKLAHEIAPLYPDGQIFLDLLGVTTPLSAAEAMAHVIRSFDPGRQLPASESELAPLYRSVLHGKRVLLFMDNAAGKAQVQPLLPPEGSALLVTSRKRFSLPGLVERDLDELPREESRELLLKICPRIGEYAEDLAKICCDLPLALRVAASTLQERRTLSCESYLQRLSTGRERLEPFDKALSLSYELLSEELRLRWRQLAVFPDTFGQEAAAAVWEVDADTAEPILAELERNSLLEWEETDKRYRLHDLVRSFVEGRLDEIERRAARERHAQHYLAVLGRATDLYLKGGENVVCSLKLFDLEWRNIQAGQAFAAAEVAQSDKGARLCSEYSDTGAYFLDLRQTPQERISWLEAAIAAARRLKDRQAEGNHLGSLGGAHIDLREPRQAIEFYEQALTIHREIGNRRGEGTALGSLGVAYAELREPRQAIEFYEKQLALTRGIGDRRGKCVALGNLGNAYADLGEPHRAIECYEQQLVLSREIGYREGEAITSWNLGLIYEQEDPTRAAKLMQVRVNFLREIGHSDAEAVAAYVEAIRA